LMGMGAKSRIGFHHVIVAHQKQSMMGVVRIVMVRKAEAVVRIEPANFGVKPLMTPANINWNLRRLFRIHENPS